MRTRSHVGIRNNYNEFVASKDDPNSLLSTARNISPNNASEIDKQLQTFTSDMQKLEQGKMSYSEMRALYG
jgi:hypothetical protein